MTQSSLSETLKQMAKDHESRSNTDRLRDVFDEVQAALAAGVSRAAVLQAINADGIKISLATFDNAMHRIRKERSGSAQSRAPKHTKPTTSAIPKQTKEAPQTATATTGDDWLSPHDLLQARTRSVDLESLGKPKTPSQL